MPELGINLIDTADSYGPEISERLIREALHPYKGLVIATKGGLLRPGPDIWIPCGKPDYLRQQVFVSMRRLGVERIDLWQLHRIDPGVPRDEQFDAIAAMQKEGLIRHVGLSEVNVEQIKAAQKHFQVATVQNLYNLANRSSERSSTLREARHRLHPVVPARGRRARQARLGARHHRPATTARAPARSPSPGC